MAARIGLLAWLYVWLSLIQAMPVLAAPDREKLLRDPEVYGTFAVFKVDEAWWKLDQTARASAAAEAKALFQKHGERLAVDVYLLRGLTPGRISSSASIPPNCSITRIFSWS